jgi:hypothetical protein
VRAVADYTTSKDIRFQKATIFIGSAQNHHKSTRLFASLFSLIASHIIAADLRQVIVRFEMAANIPSLCVHVNEHDAANNAGPVICVLPMQKVNETTSYDDSYAKGEIRCQV